MKLYSSPRSPYVRKVRIVLHEKSITYENLLERSALPAANPLGKVPTLVLDSGKAVYDSPVIVEYLDGLVEHPRMIPTEFAARLEVKRWEALGDGIADETVAISHDRHNPKEKQQDELWYAKHREKIDRGIATFARDVGEREFCFGSTFTLADVAVGYALCYIDFVLPEIEWRTPYPNLRRLVDRYCTRASFQKSAHVAPV